MLAIRNGNDDKLPSSLLEKLFKDALISIKERYQEYFDTHSKFYLKGAPYLETSKIILVNIVGMERKIFILKPGLWRGERPIWNIYGEVFTKNVIKIAEEELKEKVITQLAEPVGLIIKHVTS